MNWSDIKEIVAKAAPVAGTLLGGPAGGAIGALIASTLGVEGDPAAVDAMLRTNPDAALKLREMELTHGIEMQSLLLQAEAQRHAEVNATMRAEYQQDDPYVKRWRPTLGYAVTFSWVITWIAIVYAIVAKPAEAPDVIEALAATGVMWSVALSILGINVSRRSDDKAVAAGHPPPVGLVQSLAERIRASQR